MPPPGRLYLRRTSLSIFLSVSSVSWPEKDPISELKPSNKTLKMSIWKRICSKQTSRTRLQRTYIFRDTIQWSTIEYKWKFFFYKNERITYVWKWRLMFSAVLMYPCFVSTDCACSTWLVTLSGKLGPKRIAAWPRRMLAWLKSYGKSKCVSRNSIVDVFILKLRTGTIAVETVFFRSSSGVSSLSKPERYVLRNSRFCAWILLLFKCRIQSLGTHQWGLRQPRQHDRKHPGFAGTRMTGQTTYHLRWMTLPECEYVHCTSLGIHLEVL